MLCIGNVGCVAKKNSLVTEAIGTSEVASDGYTAQAKAKRTECVLKA